MREPEDDLGIGEIVDKAGDVLRRRAWWVLGPACAVALAVALVVTLLPNRYTSRATLEVTQPLVSERYVVPVATAAVADAVNAMTRSILSRTRLLSVIDEVGLYEDERNRKSPEALVGRMLEDVKIVPLDTGANGNFTTFQISFIGEGPLIAQRVTSRLASLFIEENLKQQDTRAENTASFLSEQLDAARKKLEEQEQRLENFQRTNRTDLPQEQQLGASSFMDARAQLRATISEIGRAERQRDSLERELRALLVRLQAERTELLNRYTDRHPEVLKKDEQIAKAQAWLSRQLSGAKKSPPASESVLADPAFAQLDSALKDNAADLEALSEEEKRLRTEVAQYQRQLNLAPVRDRELAEIQRDADLYKKNYNDLLAKQLDSQLTINLEERQQGRQFRVLDPPSLPVTPSSPDRLKISLGGVVAGMLLGVVLAFLRDAADGSFHTEKDLSSLLGAPLIMSLPLLLTPAEERTRKWGRALEWIAASVLMMTVVAAEMYIYRQG
jgi:protein tyrosine kinase modulator